MDKVRLEDNERLDIEDTLDLQNLTYDYIGRCLGGIMGVASGCIDPPTLVVYPATETIAIQGGLFYHSSREEKAGTTTSFGGYSVGRVLRMDPTEPAQDNIVDYSNFTSVDDFAIWCRRVADNPDGNSVESSRKIWDPVTGTEIQQNIRTRHIEILEFTAAHANPGTGSAELREWFPIAVVVGSVTAASSTWDNDSWGDAGIGKPVVGSSPGHLWSAGDWDTDSNPVPRPVYVWDYSVHSGQQIDAIVDLYRLPTVDDYGLVGYETEALNTTPDGLLTGNANHLDPRGVESSSANHATRSKGPLGLVGMLQDIRWMLSKIKDSSPEYFSWHKGGWDKNWLYQAPLGANADGALEAAAPANSNGMNNVVFKGLRQLYDYINSLVGRERMGDGWISGGTTYRDPINFDTKSGEVTSDDFNLQSQIDTLLVRVAELETFKTSAETTLNGMLANNRRIIAAVAFDHNPKTGKQAEWFAHGFGLRGMANDGPSTFASHDSGGAGFESFNFMYGVNATDAAEPDTHEAGQGGLSAATTGDNLDKGTYRFTVEGHAVAVFVTPKNPGHGSVNYGFGESNSSTQHAPTTIFWPEYHDYWGAGKSVGEGTSLSQTHVSSDMHKWPALLGPNAAYQTVTATIDRVEDIGAETYTTIRISTGVLIDSDNSSAHTDNLGDGNAMDAAGATETNAHNEMGGMHFAARPCRGSFYLIAIGTPNPLTT
jgi:hypothetical protein